MKDFSLGEHINGRQGVEAEQRKEWITFLSRIRHMRDRRSRALSALDAVLEHLSELEVPKDLLSPLLDIKDAFIETERGLIHPILEPKPRRGRHPRLLLQMERQCLAALFFDALVLAGESQEQAGKKVAKRLKELENPEYEFPAKSERQWRTVINMRNDLAKTAAGKGRRGKSSDEREVAELSYGRKSNRLKDAVEKERREHSDLAAKELAKKLANDLLEELSAL
jgi:hypothetical protein